MRRAPADDGDATGRRRSETGWAVLVAALALVGPAGAQDSSRGAAVPAPVVVTGALTAASPLLVDGNGTRLREGIGAAISAALSPDRWHTGALRGELTARLAAAPLRLRDGAERWRGGTVWRVDLIATAGWHAGRLSLHAGPGLGWLGAERVPAVGSRLRPLLEASARLAVTERWGTSLTVQGSHLRPAAGQAGVVGRAMIGVTHAF